jgi:hypothetical protein
MVSPGCAFAGIDGAALLCGPDVRASLTLPGGPLMVWTP